MWWLFHKFYLWSYDISAISCILVRVLYLSFLDYTIFPQFIVHVTVSDVHFSKIYVDVVTFSQVLQLIRRKFNDFMYVSSVLVTFAQSFHNFFWVLLIFGWFWYTFKQNLHWCDDFFTSFTIDRMTFQRFHVFLSEFYTFAS